MGSADAPVLSLVTRPSLYQEEVFSRQLNARRADGLARFERFQTSS